MSLTHTCVQASDNKIYINPYISGEDFFICFDDDDPPELVIKVNNKSDTELNQRAINIINDLNLIATITSKPQKSGRIFNQNINQNFNFITAYSVFLSIKAPIPISIITSHNGIYDGLSECTLYKWNNPPIPQIEPKHDGQRLWPSKKPKWLPNKKKTKPQQQPITINPKNIIFIPTKSGNKIAATIKQKTDKGFTLLIYNQNTLTFDREVTVPDLSTPIE